MEHGRIDTLYLLITAVVSFFVTIAIVYLMDIVRPGLIHSKAGTSVFIYIGVFSANLIIDALHRRVEKKRRM
ncbi:MAG TPA: hypothetical protein PKM41_02315 [Deltaproteobacteria bacterium]|jgi:hypothetical protein|nr:hypothetical protein [Deltaproteobacteria bacterium]